MKPAKRKRILERDGYRCRYCGVPGDDRTLTIDHILPRSAGGNNDYGNCVACCRTCNGQKTNMSLDAFRALRAARGMRVSVPFPKWKDTGS